MKSNFKNIFKKYSDLKYSLLKNLDIRKTKIQGIWNQINSPRKKVISKKKNKKSKLNKQKSIFSNIEISKIRFLKDYGYSLIKKISKIRFLKDYDYSLIKKISKIRFLKDYGYSLIKKISKINKLKYNKFDLNNIQKNFGKDIIKNSLSRKLNFSSNKFFKNNFSSKINFKKYDEKIEKYLKFKVSDIIKKFKSVNVSKDTKKIGLLIDFLGIYYVNNKLFFAHLQRKNKSNIIKDIAKINAPSDLIGEYKIEKIPEFRRMVNDMANVFELNNPPIILLLSSSFFTTRSFNDSELVFFSDQDPVILSKSPYLPDNTLIQYKRVNGDKNSSYHRVVYADKEVIDSWVNSLSLIGSEIATLTCPAIHIIETLTKKSEKETFILCDIEDSITNIYVLRNDCELFSERLPFGSSVYISGEESLNDQFFSRLDSSIKSILSKNNLSLDDNIYINGNGIDKMLSINNKIRDGFIKIPKNKYKLNPKKVSTFKNENSILNSFSYLLDTLIK